MTPLRCLVFLSVLAASPALIWAECDQANPKLCAEPIMRGAAAPFTGQLLTIDLAVKLGQKAERCDVTTAAEVDYQRKLDAIDLGLERQLRKQDAEACSQRLEATRSYYRELTEQYAFYREPWFVAAATFVLTIAAYTAAVKAAGSLR